MLSTVRAHRPLVVALAAIVIVAQQDASAASLAALEGGPWADADRVVALAREASTHILGWIDRSYAKRPAVMIGLAGMLLVPPLMLLGLLLYPRPAKPVAVAGGAAPGVERARFEIEGATAITLPRGRELVQIGRQSDNDICIDDDGVQGYHAVVARSDEQGFTITDVSGLSADGLRVNGQRRTSAVLANGDMVELGRARMRFATASQ